MPVADIVQDSVHNLPVFLRNSVRKDFFRRLSEVVSLSIGTVIDDDFAQIVVNDGSK